MVLSRLAGGQCGLDLGPTVVIWVDATIQIAHSDKWRGGHVQGFVGSSSVGGVV